MEKRDFDGVLAILMQWIDRPVAVGIDGPGDGGLATMRGTLRAARDIAKPFDEEEFEFTVSEDPVCGFSLHHGYFDGADYFEDSQLIVQLTENAGGWRSSVVIHVVLHGSALA